MKPRNILHALLLSTGIALPLAVNASVVTLGFSGTYDTFGNTVYGESGNAVPYYFQITYDTTLDTNSTFVAAGTVFGGLTTTHDWFGYSKSGVVATNLTFGSKTWTIDDLMDRYPVAGITADLWFDTDISVHTPTRSWIVFDNNNDPLQLGGGMANLTNIFMLQTSQAGSGMSNTAYSDAMSIAPVPEAETWAMMLAGLGLVGFVARRRKAQSA